MKDLDLFTYIGKMKVDGILPIKMYNCNECHTTRSLYSLDHPCQGLYTKMVKVLRGRIEQND